MVQQKCPHDRLNFANLIPSEKGAPNPNIPQKGMTAKKKYLYELIRLAYQSYTSLFDLLC